MRVWLMGCTVVAALLAFGSIGCNDLSNAGEFRIVKDPPKPPPAPVVAAKPAARAAAAAAGTG